MFLLDWLKKQARKSAQSSGKNKTKRNNVARTTRSNSKGNNSKQAQTAGKKTVQKTVNTVKRGGVVISNKTAAKIKSEQQKKKKQQSQSLTGTENYKKLQKKREEAAKRGGNRTREQRKESIEATKNRLKHVYEANAKSIADQTKKALEKSQNIDALGVKNGTVTYKTADGKTKKVKNLTSNEYLQLQNAERLPSKKAKDAALGKELSKKVGSVNTAAYQNSKGAMGFMEAMNPLPIELDKAGAGTYTKEQKKTIEKAKDSTAYKVGYGLGTVGSFAMTGASGAEKAVGTGIAKTVAKKTGKEALGKVGKFTVNRAADVVTSTPFNLNEALKYSRDDKGNLDIKQAAKTLGVNTAADVLIGGAFEGIGKGLSVFKNKADYNKYIKIKAKKEAGAKLSKAEQDFYNKGRRELTNQYIEKEVQKEMEALKSKASESSIKVNENHTKQEIERINKYRESTDLGLLTFIDKVDNLSDKNVASKLNKSIGKVGQRESEAIKKITGIDVSGFRHNINGATINHIKNRHGINGKADSSMAINSDIARLNHIIKEYDNVYAVKTSDLDKDTRALSKAWQNSNQSPSQVIRYEKRVDGTYYIVEAVPDSNKKKLQVISAYISNKKSTPELVNMENSPHLTSKTSAPSVETDSTKAPNADVGPEPTARGTTSSLLDNSISRNGENVNNSKIDPEWEKEVDAALRGVELEDLKKQQRALRYMLQNTKNAEHYKEYRAKLDEVNNRIDEIYEKNNHAPKEEVNTREQRTLDELKADKNSAKASTESKSVKQDASFKETTDKAWQSTKRLLVDNFAAFENIGRTLRKVDQAKGDSFMASINALRLTKNKAGAMLKDGRINRYGKSDKSLVQIFNNKEYGNLLKDKEKYEDFQYYLFNRHNIDRAREGKNVFGDISSSESESIAKELEKKYGKEFTDRANEIYSYLADLEDMRVKSGLSSAEQSAELDNIYKSYVPTYRVNDNVSVSGESGKLKNYKQYEATGGNSEIMPIHEQLVMLTNKTVRESEKNLLMKAVADSQGLTVNELSELGVKNPEKILDKLLYKNDTGTKHEVTYFVDGKANTVSITDEMYKGMQDWSKQDYAAIIKMVDKVTTPLNRVFKALVTDYNPIFMIRNFVRDTQEAFFYSKDTRYWVKNWPKAISALTSKNSEYRQAYELYKASGGKYSNLVDLETDVSKLDTGWKKKNPLERVEALNNAIETIPRLAEFMGTLDKAGIKLSDTTNISKDILNKAMYNANDITLNFGRSGNVTKYLNRTVIPYLNPSIQGLDKLVRTLQGDRGARGYFGLIAKGTIFMVAPSIANSLLCKDVKGYEYINDRDKENNFLFPVGDEKFIKVPKSRVGAIVSMPARMSLESWQYGNSFDWKYLFKQSWELQGIVDVSNGGLFQPFMGAATNKTWYGGQIESGSEDDTYESEVWKTKHGRSNEVYDSNTSAIGKYLGNTAIMKKLGISPKKIDYVLDGTTGIIGDILLPATSQNSAGRPSAVISKSFVLDAVFSNKLSTDFYEKASKLRGNQVISEAEKNKYYEFQCRYGYSASTILQSIADIQSSDMSKAEKAEKSRELRKALNEIYKNERDGVKSVSDALTPIGKVIGFDKALSGYLYDNKSSGINHANAYKIYRENLSLDKMKPADREKAAKQFLNSYNKAINIQSRIAPNYSNNPDYKTLAVTGALMGNKAFSDAYGVSDDNQKLAKDYINSYDNKRQAINMHISTQKTLKKGNDEISKLFPKYNSSTTSTKAMIIASSNQLDSQYYFNECDRKMNGARGLTKDYGYTPKSFEKIRSEANTDGKSGISKDEAMAAVEKANCKDNNERALLFNMLCSSWNARNPYGTPKDYSLDSDNWKGKKKDSNNSYSGYRRYGRSYGRSGGSSGSGSSGSLESWEEFVKDFISTPTTASSSSKKSTYKSPLDEAYRAKIDKIVKNMRV